MCPIDSEPIHPLSYARDNTHASNTPSVCWVNLLFFLPQAMGTYLNRVTVKACMCKLKMGGYVTPDRGDRWKRGKAGRINDSERLWSVYTYTGILIEATRATNKHWDLKKHLVFSPRLPVLIYQEGATLSSIEILSTLESKKRTVACKNQWEQSHTLKHYVHFNLFS